MIIIPFAFTISDINFTNHSKLDTQNDSQINMKQARDF